MTLVEGSIIIFLHVPKTAGSSLGQAMHRQYKRSSIFLINGNNPEQSVKEFISLPDKQRESFQCISGHIPFGLHEYISRPTIYTTVLRNPIERVISLYQHVLREPMHYMHEAVKSKKMSMQDFVNSRLSRELYDDQTRMLSGVGKWNQVTDKTSIDDMAFNKAIQNIENFFPVVGLTEMFDESLLLMKEAFSWNNVFYSKRKVANSRPMQNNLDSHTIETIKTQNHYDILLYEYAKQRLQYQIDERGIRYNYRVYWFRIMNNIYNQVRKNKQLPAISTLWKAVGRIMIRKL